MVSLRADGVIAILCPVGSDTLAGVAIMTVPPEKAREYMDADPCVQAKMMRCEVHSCHGFPGDALPAWTAPTIKRLDHVGVVVSDLEAAIAFFIELGMELDGGISPVEGDWVNSVVGLDDVRIEIAFVQTLAVTAGLS